MTKLNWSWLGIVLLALTLTTFTACDDDDIQVDEGIIEFLDNNQEYSLFRDALEEAELEDNLSFYTVDLTFFVPTNDAMTNFLQTNGFSDLQAVPDELLRATLLNHIVGGQALIAAQLQTGYYPTLNDQEVENLFTDIYIAVDNGVIINGDIAVTQTDQVVEEGIVHEIDQVIMPSTLLTFATADPNFSSLVAAITIVDADGSLTDALSSLSAEPLTVLAPTNTAFQDLLDSNENWTSLADIDEATLESVLLYHLIPDNRILSTEIVDGQSVSTAAGGTVQFDLSGTAPAVVASGSTATILLTDVIAQNGVIHAIDTVLLPQ
jgi:uncharacterized surface protein with fasciclin (FAS1) repeats